MNNIILHIPHSSLILPNHFLNNKFNIPLDEINAFNKNISDLFTNELFPTKIYLENNIKSAQFEKLKNEIETLVEEIKILNL